MRTRYPTPVRTLTILLIACYVAISVLAGACAGADMSSAADHHHGQAHHGGLHAVLCALACQVNLTSGFISSAPGVQHVLLFLGVLVVASFFDQFPRPDDIRTRAPPAPIFIR